MSTSIQQTATPALEAQAKTLRALLITIWVLIAAVIAAFGWLILTRGWQSSYLPAMAPAFVTLAFSGMIGARLGGIRRELNQRR